MDIVLLLLYRNNNKYTYLTPPKKEDLKDCRASLIVLDSEFHSKRKGPIAIAQSTVLGRGHAVGGGQWKSMEVDGLLKGICLTGSHLRLWRTGAICGLWSG